MEVFLYWLIKLLLGTDGNLLSFDSSFYSIGSCMKFMDLFKDDSDKRNLEKRNRITPS